MSVDVKKTRVPGLPIGENRIILRSLVLTQYQRVTDMQTDIQTHPVATSRSSIPKRDKNCQHCHVRLVVTFFRIASFTHCHNSLMPVTCRAHTLNIGLHVDNHLCCPSQDCQLPVCQMRMMGPKHLQLSLHFRSSSSSSSAAAAAAASSTCLTWPKSCQLWNYCIHRKYQKKNQ